MRTSKPTLASIREMLFAVGIASSRRRSSLLQRDTVASFAGSGGSATSSVITS